MKKTLLLAGLLCSASLFAQTSIFSDDFESGSSNWILNTGSGDNQWVVNNSYTGYNPVIADTPDQPSGVTGSPQSNYLHINNVTACSNLSVCNASFDTGSASNQDVTMASPIVTTGMTSVTLSFYYLCEGASGVSFGTLQYSTDGGSSWTDVATYSGVSTWTQESQSLPSWDNQASLTFRFNWTNGGSGNDPAFAIDELSVVGVGGSTETITNVASNNSGWCYDDQSNFNVTFTSAGTYTTGNVFTAELSDETGDFSSPITIGTLNSTSSGNLSIPCVIPTGTAVGNGYRIRVSSSQPVVVGTDNGIDLSIYPLPNVTAGTDQTVCEGETVSLSASGADTYVWDNGVTDGVSFTPLLGTTTYTVVGTSVNGCEATDQVVITVEDCTGLEENSINSSVTFFPNPVNTHFTLKGATQLTSLKVIDLSGRTVQTLKPNSLNAYVIKGINAGTYFLSFTDGKSTFLKRFVKQ